MLGYCKHLSLKSSKGTVRKALEKSKSETDLIEKRIKAELASDRIDSFEEMVDRIYRRIDLLASPSGALHSSSPDRTILRSVFYALCSTLT